MRQLVTFLGLFMAFHLPVFSAQAESEALSKTVCSSLEARVCAQMQMDQNPSSQRDNPFILDLQSAGSSLTDLKIDIWMNMGGHGHGSSPVEIKALGNNRFEISNVWFVMTGAWDVKISFSANGNFHQIQIPVQVMN